MPRDGSGGYDRATPGTPYVNGTTIDETVVNAEMDDIGNEIASSLSKDGQTVPTNNLPMGGYKHTGVGDATAAAHYAAAGQVQKGSLLAATVGGTANALTFTLSPAPAAYTTNMEWSGIAANTCAAGATTGNLNSIGNKDVKRPDLTDPLAGDIVSGQRYTWAYNGTYIIVTNPSRVVTQSASDNSTKPASTGYVDTAVNAAVATNLSQLPVRQTILSGPVDSAGLPDFGGSTGGTTVTMSGTLIATAANGFGSAGGVNRVGSITNAAWSGLSTNGTMYLGLTVNADGTCTAFATTLAPTYQWGGTYSTSNGQRTFNIQEMTMKVGNGTVAAQAYDVFVGEVTVAGNVVTAITWYALQGRYQSAAQAFPANSSSTTFSHNIGSKPGQIRVIAVCVTAEGSYVAGDEADIPVSTYNGGAYFAAQNAMSTTRNVLTYRTGSYGATVVADGATQILLGSNAKWNIRAEAYRGW